MVKRVGFQIDVDSTGLNRGLDEAGSRFVRIQESIEETPNLADKLGVEGEAQEGVAQLTSSLGLMVDKLSQVGIEFGDLIRKMDDINGRFKSPLQPTGSIQNSSTDSVSNESQQKKQVQKNSRAGRQIYNTGSFGMGFATGQPGAGISSALSGIPLIGGALGGASQFALSAYSQGAGTMMGNQAASRGARSSLGVNENDMRDIKRDGLRLGFSHAQTMQELQQYGRSAGSIDGFTRSQGIQRGYGINSGTMTGLADAARTTGGDIGSLQNALVAAIEGGPFSRALSQELATASAELIKQSGARGGDVASSKMVGMIASMSAALGGKYEKSPGKTGALLGSLDQGIAGSLTGGDSAVQSQMLYALSASNPNMTHAQLMVQAEKGIGGGNLDALLQQADRNYGNMEEDQRLDMTQMFLAKVGGISHTRAKDVAQAHIKGNIKSLNLSGDQTSTMKKRARESQSGMGLTQRNLYLSEQRANVAQAADPTVALMQQQQLRALQALTVAAGGMSKAATYLSNPKQVAKDVGQGVGTALEPFMKTIDGYIRRDSNQVKYTVVPGQKRKGSH